jgi:hypothetical protein
MRKVWFELASDSCDYLSFYDCDGKWDFAIFRPENGFWYAMQSQARFMAVNFGAAGDRPAPAGYVPQN